MESNKTGALRDGSFERKIIQAPALGKASVDNRYLGHVLYWHVSLISNTFSDPSRAFLLISPPRFTDLALKIT